MEEFLENYDFEFRKKNYSEINSIKDEPFTGSPRMVGEAKNSPPPWNLSHISYNDETWHSYTLPKKIQTIYNTRDTPLEFCCYQDFFTGNQQLLLYQEIQIYVAF